LFALRNFQDFGILRNLSLVEIPSASVVVVSLFAHLSLDACFRCQTNAILRRMPRTPPRANKRIAA
jgi:hypothetical protein